MHRACAQVADAEQAQQQAALAPPFAVAAAELDGLPTFDARSYYHQVNMLQEAAAAASSSSHYSQLQATTTALHLGYEAYEMKLKY